VDLYRTILPRPVGTSEVVAVKQVAEQAPGTESVWVEDPSRAAEPRRGIYVGRTRITPSFQLLYVRAEGALFDTTAPVDDRYYELRPQLVAEMPVSSGFLRGAYQAHIRRGSSFELVNSTTTHLADASAQVPIGSALEIVASEHFARGVLETTEVDPGREYFFGLGRFTRHIHGAGVRLLPGGRTDAGIAASLDTVRVDDRSTFFDHERQIVSAQLGYEVRPDLRVGVGYSFTRLPPPQERPLAESAEHYVFAELRGEILPLTTGNIAIGQLRRTSPNAATGGNEYTGLSASARLEKSFTPSTRLSLVASRTTHVSSFEENAFYVTSSGQFLLQMEGPWSTSLEGGGGYHRNDYRTIASSIGAPRRDVIRGWTVGVARQATRHAFIRVDYRRERRDSNIDAFDTHSNSLIVNIGIGMFDAPSPR